MFAQKLLLNEILINWSKIIIKDIYYHVERAEKFFYKKQIINRKSNAFLHNYKCKQNEQNLNFSFKQNLFTLNIAGTKKSEILQVLDFSIVQKIVWKRQNLWKLIPLQKTNTFLLTRYFGWLWIFCGCLCPNVSFKSQWIWSKWNKYTCSELQHLKALVFKSQKCWIGLAI